MGVAERVDGDAAQQVDVLTTVGVPHPRARAANQGDGRRAEGVHDGAGVAVGEGGVVVRGVAHDLSPVPYGLRIRVAIPGSTWVPTPSSVKISSSTECGSRPSTTVARGTPPVTAS